MTTTTTVTMATRAEIQHILTDYEIRLTGSESGTSTQSANLHRDQLPTTENPPNWLSNYRRVPDYRPINRELDYNERTLGSNAFEFAFLNVMFTGVAVNAVSADKCRVKVRY